MGEKREQAMGLLKRMLAPEMAAELGKGPTGPSFAGKIGEMAMNNIFEPLWTDDTLDTRTRSLVTVSILIALRAYDELEIHFPAAIRNGATVAELEQVIYQASGYAGFPAAHSARNVAIAALGRAGMLG
ncbi:MAG: carboxymuconolactone decarboxylase [Sphingobium sp.]|nr:carboxymuconolactone decarboxylase [Sphingobium sp.]